jgi:hypothetical protein
MKGAVTTESQNAAAQQVNTEDGGDRQNTPAVSDLDPSPAAPSQAQIDDGRKAIGGETSDPVNPAAASSAGSELLPPASAPSAGAAGPVTGKLPPRRRGILLGMRPGAEAPAAADDAKSLSWMATQAVKATNAVKASQMEQAQALKARMEGSPDESSLAWEEEGIGLDAGGPVPPSPEIAPPPATPSRVQTAAAGQPTPVESSPAAAAGPQVPAVARRAATARVPARLILVLGTLVVIGWLGYRHWFGGEHTASEAPAPSSAISEPDGPAAGVELMAPAISVVPAPVPTAGRSEPATAGIETAPAPAAAVPPAMTLERVEPVTPAGEAHGEAVTGNAPQPATAPAAAVPPAMTLERVEPAMPAGEAHGEVVTGNAPQPVPAAPAPRPQSPANGYGYYPPPSSWQPYYRPGYPQAPARQ